MTMSEVTCNICTRNFDLDSEGGITGVLGILPVDFCPTCLAGIIDMVSQFTEVDNDQTR